METPVWDLKSQFEKYQGKDVFDCLLAEFLLSQGKYSPKLPEALHLYKVQTIEELAEKQEAKLKEFPKLSSLLIDVEQPLSPILLQMEKRGVLLDTNRLKEICIDIDEAIVNLENKIKKRNRK